MESEKSGRAPSFEEQTIKAIKDLQALQKQHLNRQLAFEAMMEAMLARVQPEALPGLLVEYESACDRLAALLPPEHQAPELWKQWTVEIERLMRKHQTPPTTWSLPT